MKFAGKNVDKKNIIGLWQSTCQPWKITLALMEDVLSEKFESKKESDKRYDELNNLITFD